MAAVVCEIAKHSMYIILVLLCVAVQFRESNARSLAPTPISDRFKDTSDCNNDAELLDLCQRCAKITKSRLAYPKCCSKNDMEARRWCSEFVFFGIGQDARKRYNFS